MKKKKKINGDIGILIIVWLFVLSVLFIGSFFPRDKDYRCTIEHFSSIKHCLDSHGGDHFRLKTKEGSVYWMQHPVGMYAETVTAAFAEGDVLDIEYLWTFSKRKYISSICLDGQTLISHEETVAFYNPFKIICRILILLWLVAPFIVLRAIRRLPVKNNDSRRGRFSTTQSSKKATKT